MIYRIQNLRHPLCSVAMIHRRCCYTAGKGCEPWWGYLPACFPLYLLSNVPVLPDLVDIPWIVGIYERKNEDA